MPAFEVRKEVLGGREDGAGRVERVSRGSCGGSDGLGGHRVLFDRGIDEPRGGGGGGFMGKVRERRGAKAWTALSLRRPGLPRPGPALPLARLSGAKTRTAARLLAPGGYDAGSP